jgi:hypothetical protein
MSRRTLALTTPAAPSRTTALRRDDALADSTVPTMSIEAEIKAHGCSFVLEIDGYEFPDLPADYHDANWLVGRVELEAGSVGRFSGRLRVTPFAPDLHAFRDQLAVLDRDLSGTATLAHLEDQFGIEISLQSGKGELSAFIGEHVGASVKVEGCELDQSYIRQALAQVDALAKAFPVRRL